MKVPDLTIAPPLNLDPSPLWKPLAVIFTSLRMESHDQQQDGSILRTMWIGSLARYRMRKEVLLLDSKKPKVISHFIVAGFFGHHTAPLCKTH
jgi:hypothetical protein